MAEITTGVRRLLSHPAIYDVIQRVFGAEKGRSEFVDEFLQPCAGERLLDIGSGTSDLLAYVPAEVEYVGIEPSARYSTSARERFGDRGRFITGMYDEARAQELGRFDVVVLSGVIHHLDDRQLLSLYGLIREFGLSPAGRLVSIDPVFEAGQAMLARWFISMDRGRNVRSPRQYDALACGVFANVAGVVRHRAFPPYTHYIMTCRAAVHTAVQG